MTKSPRISVALAHDDCVNLAEHLPAGSVELAYLDPPFFVGVDFAARASGGASAGGTRTRAKGPVAYSDRWPSFDAYLESLTARFAVVRDLLSHEGTLWLHLDHRAVHEAKVILDRLFGRERFLGEVVWVPGNGTKARKGPGTTHQTLLLYAKSDAYVWNADAPELREPFAKTSLSMHFGNVDDEGRRYRDRTVNGKTYRYYADRGRAIGSVWTDCPSMVANTPLRHEATGYPTQKPEKLLDRIVRASSREGALVLDPYCGSGTTLVAAAKAGRHAFGCDVGDLAIRTTSSRLAGAGIPFTRSSPSAPSPARPRATRRGPKAPAPRGRRTDPAS
ncbi:MAG: site-specific DNA-methyltransferase [Polyangiaceae bacterium]